METVEILAGGEFANAVKSLGLTSAVCTYHYQPQPTHGVKNTKFGYCPKRILTISVLSTTMTGRTIGAGGVTLMVLIWALLTAPMLSMVKS